MAQMMNDPEIEALGRLIKQLKEEGYQSNAGLTVKVSTGLFSHSWITISNWDWDCINNMYYKMISQMRSRNKNPKF